MAHLCIGASSQDGCPLLWRHDAAAERVYRIFDRGLGAETGAYRGDPPVPPPNVVVKDPVRQRVEKQVRVCPHASGGPQTVQNQDADAFPGLGAAQGGHYRTEP